METATLYDFLMALRQQGWPSTDGQIDTCAWQSFEWRPNGVPASWLPTPVQWNACCTIQLEAADLSVPQTVQEADNVEADSDCLGLDWPSMITGLQCLLCALTRWTPSPGPSRRLSTKTSRSQPNQVKSTGRPGVCDVCRLWVVTRLARHRRVWQVYVWLHEGPSSGNGNGARVARYVPVCPCPIDGRLSRSTRALHNQWLAPLKSATGSNSTAREHNTMECKLWLTAAPGIVVVLAVTNQQGAVVFYRLTEGPFLPAATVTPCLP